jgi:hypothetical protein
MLKSRKRPKKDQRAQFVETVRRLGTDMDEEKFKRAMTKIAPAKEPAKK